MSGKTAVVTGATGELGRVIAVTLAERGADVAIHTCESQDTATALEKRSWEIGSRCCVVQGDTDVSTI